MKSFLFCTSYTHEGIQALHPERYSKWIRYYQPILDDLGASHIFLIDDGSAQEGLAKINEIDAVLPVVNLPDTCEGKVNLISFDTHLGRRSGVHYPGWWRSFTFSLLLAERYGFEKIIHVESDFYILSDRLKSYINNIQTGWISLYSQVYDFPETAIQVICRDSYPQFGEILNRGLNSRYYFGQKAELILPFTRVDRGFTGDRIGEFEVFKQWAQQERDFIEIDYIGQLHPNIKTVSSTELRGLFSAFNEGATGIDEQDSRFLMELFQTKDLLV
jgi:hypothetical protein